MKKYFFNSVDVFADNKTKIKSLHSPNCFQTFINHSNKFPFNYKKFPNPETCNPLNSYPSLPKTVKPLRHNDLCYLNSFFVFSWEFESTRPSEKSRNSSEMNPEKLKKLQAQAELVRIGGKGRRSEWNNAKSRWKMRKTEINIKIRENEWIS